jgi:immune inhibitor A
MAAGSWGCGSDDREAWVRPTHMGAWEKEQLGWLSHIEEVAPALIQEVTLTPVISSEHVLKIPLEDGVPTDTNEYLLLEYRTQEGFDEDIPGSGVLIYHVDPTMPNNQLLWHEPNWYKVALLEADGNFSLQRNSAGGGNRGEPGDAWGVGGFGPLSHSTTPSSRLNSGDRSLVTIYDISVNDGVATITLSNSVVADATLLSGFLGTSATPLTAEQESYLDTYGNGNGQYDVGDLRAYLKR